MESIRSVGLFSNTFSEVKGGEKTSGTVSFGDYLKEALNKVNQLQFDSEKLTNAFASGATDNIHQVLIAAEKADVALQFTLQVRNKILDAYNEIMRMQI